MTVSVTELKARCLEIIREVERDQKVVEIVRRGEVVARLLPAGADSHANTKPWERLRGTGELLGPPEQSVLEQRDFEALR
ncbi:MAG TPA: type II toxin-antitoxin system prevent-host-death family antitoxin [Thermoanaerobaculia bacterium]|jgi:prevent-host-death family protein|nr:type II toxin-antitoxin system prevent-host-death family antitoxin [Thermoanaerobaculia bacterium]